MFFLQIIGADTVRTVETVQEMSVFDLMKHGGIIMIPILLLSVISIYLFFEKLFFIRSRVKMERGLADRIGAEISKGNRDNALFLCQNSNSAFGRIYACGIEYAGKPLKDIERMMESTANVEIAQMEKSLGYLGIISGIAPMLGFIGTIAGVITIFYNISMTDNISIGVISGGLYQKMITSGTGLIVGVIAYSCYHYLQIQIDNFSRKVQEDTLVLVKYLQQ